MHQSVLAPARARIDAHHARTHARTHALAHSRRNFGKFLVDKEGAVAGRYAPDEDPLNLEPEITSLL